ncbi:hypothetical protein BC941DRAFT_417515 [Chlamydoabsidia padenii]|nr:hypothetical protein BC941DRAFT_417515 [Chlamydoabsidia padenii]
MDKVQLKTLVQSYRQYETNFMTTLTPSTALDDSLLYGEMAFCLAGLKSAVLIDLPVGLISAYTKAVIEPWMRQYDKELMGDWILIQRRLYSPEIQGNMVFLFVHLPQLTTSMRTSLMLSPQATSLSDQCDIGSEDELAMLLDYPGRLPRSMLELDTMREVAYYNQLDKTILTTFACQLEQQDNVHSHFKLYQDTMLLIGLPLGLIFRRPT